MGKYVFAYGFRRRHLSRDGRQQGETPGAIGGGESDREDAILGAMRDHAVRGRIAAVLGAIEPGRNQLLLQHEYTLMEIYAALRTRPFIPQGHQLLWAKAIHAGFVGEYDIAVHILAPQMENALREVLRRQGEIVYATRDGVQSLISIENVLDHSKSQQIFGDDLLFALDTSLAGRLGANVRNEVAHGLLDDVFSNSYDAAFVWWLALWLLRGYGPDPLVPVAPGAAPSTPYRARRRTRGRSLLLGDVAHGFNTTYKRSAKAGSRFLSLSNQVARKVTVRQQGRSRRDKTRSMVLLDTSLGCP